MQAVVQVAERIGTRRIGRRAGRLDRDIGQLGQRAQLVELAERRGVLLETQQAAMVDDQLQLRMASAILLNCGRNRPAMVATGRPSCSAAGHTQSSLPSCSAFCCSG